MHTDEFEIPLSRELDSCKKTIKRIREFLAIMERKHRISTAEFIQFVQKGTLTQNLKEDSQAWSSNYESLLIWQEMQKEYEEKLQQQPQKRHILKVSFKKGN